MEPEDPDDLEDPLVDQDEIDRQVADLHIDLDDFTDEEGEAYLDGVARAYELLPQQRQEKPLPPDLQELYDDIRGIAGMRKRFLPDAKWLMFEGFEAHDARRGGMGLIIKARDTTLERWVAIKLWLNTGAEAQEALIAEARVLAKFRHPNVVGVYGTGQWRDRVYFLMEWVEGRDFHEWLQDRQSWVEVRNAFVLAGRGLAAAHEAGIQHRDFKPANILFGSDGEVLVADFGIADSLDGEFDELDLAGIVGTPSYMAPERLRGGRGDARSDQYSFCVALWRGLYGQRPYGGETREEVLEEIERGDLRVDPDADVPEWLVAVVRRGLSTSPDERYASMNELIEALSADPSDGPMTLDDRWEVRGRGSVGAGPRILHSPGRLGFLGGVLVAVVGGALWERVEPGTEAPRVPVATHALEEQDEPPCAEVPGVVVDDAVLLEVCQTIRGGHYKAADALWFSTYSVRFAPEAHDPMLGRHTLVVAATFVDQAEHIADHDPATARTVAFIGVAWNSRVANLLPGETDEALADLNDRAMSIGH